MRERRYDYIRDSYAEAFCGRVQRGESVSVIRPISDDVPACTTSRGRYATISEKDEANICLNCKRSRCPGTCPDFTRARRKLVRQAKAERKKEEVPCTVC